MSPMHISPPFVLCHLNLIPLHDRGSAGFFLIENHGAAGESRIPLLISGSRSKLAAAPILEETIGWEVLVLSPNPAE
jgi:hypothetical protein